MVDDGHAAVAGLAHAMDVQDHIVAVGEGPLDLAPGVGELLLALGDEGLEAFDAVGCAGIVLECSVARNISTPRRSPSGSAPCRRSRARPSCWPPDRQERVLPQRRSATRAREREVS